jgi:hypothetical protein
MALLLLLVGVFAQPAAEAAPTTLRYVRTTKNGVAPECVLTISTKGTRKEWLSVTDRATEKMTLRVAWIEESLVVAKVIHETAGGKKVALLERENGETTLTKNDRTEKLDAVPPQAVVTTAPDWTDIFLMIERYDRAKGGKQEFAGVWIHPEKATLRLTFSAERTGSATIMVKGKPVTLDRFRIRLRSGEYAVWANAERRVVRLQAASGTAPAVLLEGFEEATRMLMP